MEVQSTQPQLMERVNFLENLILKILKIQSKDCAIIKCCNKEVDDEIFNFLKMKFLVNENEIVDCKKSIEQNKLPQFISYDSLNTHRLILLKESGLKQLKCSKEEFNAIPQHVLNLIKTVISVSVVEIIEKIETKEIISNDNSYIPPALRKANYTPTQGIPKPIQQPSPPPPIDYNFENETILKITESKSMNVIYRMDSVNGSFPALLKVFLTCKKGLLLFKLAINNKPTSFATFHSIFPTQMGVSISDGSEYAFSIVNDPYKPYAYHVKPFNKTMMIKEDRISIFSVGTFIKKNNAVRYNGEISDLFDVPKTISSNAFIPFNGVTTTAIENGWTSISVIELK